jgi:hypothetical protein
MVSSAMQEAELTNNKQELGVDNSPFFLYSITIINKWSEQ